MASANGVVLVEGDRCRSFPDLDRQAGANLGHIEENSSGDLWFHAETETRSSLGLLQRDGKVRIFGPADGMPAGRIQAMSPDEGNGLWLGTPSGLCHWEPGRPAQCDKTLPTTADAFTRSSTGLQVVVDRSGTIWYRRGDRGAWNRSATVGESYGTRRVLPDRDGNVWVGTSHGLARFREGQVDWLTPRDGLSSTGIARLTTDAEGDLWVATQGGLDRLHAPRIRHLASPDGLSSDNVMAIAATPDGDVWAATNSNGLNRIAGGAVRVYGTAQGLPSLRISALFTDSRGRLWAATTQGAVYFDGGRFVKTEAPGTVTATYGIGGDSAGTIWRADLQLGLIPIRDGKAQPVVPVPIPQVIRATGTADGTLWVGSHAGNLATMRNGEVVEAPSFPGPIRVIYQDREGAVWVGGGATLGRFRNGRWTRWEGAYSLSDSAIQGIVEDDQSGLWVVNAEAALRLSKAELDRVRDGEPRRVAARSLGRADGLQMEQVLGSASPRVVKASDGRIWIIERASLAVLDPANLASDPVAPPVKIEGLTLDGKPLDTGGPMVFRGRELHISYTGLSLMAPERVRFRYRLQPPGDRWIDAGSNREVTYVDLPARRYRFQVSACNLDNVCNAAGTSIDFQVQPYYYQTTWFMALCGTAAGFLIWGAWRLRLRTLMARFQLVAQERARMTREIHDSLLQGFAGVVYQLDAAARQFETAPEQSKKKLDRALDLADQALREAREVLSTMRLTTLEENTLPEALERTCGPLAEAAGASFALKTRGRVEPLPYDTQAMLFLIGREAVTNAAKHAQASRIAMQLFYDGKEVRLAVQDDGAGFDAEPATNLQGHWGLRGMRERAEHQGARFRLETAPGKGTCVEVAIAR